jgi:hypothetical protein
MKKLVVIALLLIALPAFGTEDADSHLDATDLKGHSLVGKSLRGGSLITDPIHSSSSEQNDNCVPQGTEELAWNFDEIDVESGTLVQYRSDTTLGGVLDMYCYKGGAFGLPECPYLSTRGWISESRNGQGKAVRIYSPFLPPPTYLPGFRADGNRVSPKQDWSGASGSGGITISFHARNFIPTYPIGSIKSQLFGKAGEWHIGTDASSPALNRHDLCFDFVTLKDENTASPPEAFDYPECGSATDGANNWDSATSKTQGLFLYHDITWHHYVIRWDYDEVDPVGPPIKGRVSFYVDDVLVSDQHQTTEGDITNTAGNFALGQAGGFTNFVNWDVDNLIVHRGAVDPAEITAGNLNCDWVDE